MEYIKNKGILVGFFNANDVKKGIDKIKVKEYQEKYNLHYTNTELIKKNKKIVGIKIYVCNVYDFKI